MWKTEYPLSANEENDKMQEEHHPKSRAWIELDGAALEHNVNFLRSRLPENCRLMPAVKAEAYGHGAVLISRELNRLGVDAFCVACLSEGIQLRRNGIKGEILVLGYTSPEDFPLLYRHQLAQIVLDYPYAQALNRFGKTLHVHIGLDTGMHRLGIRCENPEQIKEVYRMEHLIIDGLFSHLCTSDSPLPEHRAFAEKQIRAFHQTIALLKKEGYPCPGLHLLASYGILNLLRTDSGQNVPSSREDTAPQNAWEPKELAGDYVRPGIVLYGILGTGSDSLLWKDSLRPVLSLKAKVASVRPLYAGEAAGYGITFTAKQDRKLATISIGYADGLPRELSCGKGSVLINGCKAPIVGRICMDQLSADVSEIENIQAGDTAVIIGKSGKFEITAGQLADQCGTITNEILSRLGGRLERILV